MTQVLFVYEGVTSTADLMWNFLTGFAEKKNCAVVRRDAGQVTQADMQACDVLFCSRGESPWMCELLRQARLAGKFVIFFLDDDLQHLPKNAFRYPRRKKYLLEGLKYADFFLTSNKLLAEEYLPLISGDRAAVLETAVREEQIRPRQPKGEEDTVRIVYAASRAHVSHWDKYIAPIWPAITAKYGSRIRMTFVGMKPEMPAENNGTQVEFVPPMSLAEYRAYMYDGHFDIGLSPLDTDHFSARKYYNKFIEYAMCGICGLYSDCSPYDLVVRDGENGLLVGNSPEAWQRALEKSIDHQHLRESCADNAQQLLRDAFTADKICDQLVRDVPELVTFQAPKDKTVAFSGAAKWKQRIFRLWESAYLTVTSMRRYGFGKTLERVRNKIKR